MAHSMLYVRQRVMVNKGRKGAHHETYNDNIRNLDGNGNTGDGSWCNRNRGNEMGNDSADRIWRIDSGCSIGPGLDPFTRDGKGYVQSDGHKDPVD